jgi:hypothetical protein
MITAEGQMSSGGMTSRKNLAVILGSIFLVMAIGIGILYATDDGLLALAVIWLGILAVIFLVRWMAKKQLTR